MTVMRNAVELPIVKPVYGTYHFQGDGGAILHNNPSIRTWYLNQVMLLRCDRAFLHGRTTPELDIELSGWCDIPYVERQRYEMKFLKGYMNPVIREFLSQGYYVVFEQVDDYYIPGKSWYQKRHFEHDGLICGYDQEEKTYTMFAYDDTWNYRVFKTTQKGFNDGWRSIFKQGRYGSITGIRAGGENVVLDPPNILTQLKIYLDSSLAKYPVTETGFVFGIAVQDYIALYVGFLMDGTVPYERMDRRIFRLLWEHKTVMLQRIAAVEKQFKMDSTISGEYAELVKDANTMRMLYASHHMRRRDSVLPVIQKTLIRLRNKEEEVLSRFTEKLGGVLNS